MLFSTCNKIIHLPSLARFIACHHRGRGSPSSEYSGNLRFRQLVIDRRQDYLSCTRRNQKHYVAMEIIQTVIGRGGRFLQRITTIEEAQRLKVPPRVQAWKLLEPSSSLCLKVQKFCSEVKRLCIFRCSFLTPLLLCVRYYR